MSFECKKLERIAAHCRSKLTDKFNQSPRNRPPVKYLRCLALGLINGDCKKYLEEKNLREERELLTERNETHFSFYSSADRTDIDLNLDSRANCI